MELRHLNRDEIPLYQRLARYAFDSSRNEYTDLTYPLLDTPLECLYGAFEAGRMISAATVIPYRLHLRGSTIPMGGVAGVVTRPEHRNRKAVRALMDLMVRDMHRVGQGISVLYPFKFSYWEKFGYRLADENVLYQFTLESLIAKPVENRTVEEVAGVTGEVKEIYRQVSRESSFMVERGEGEWKEFPKKNFMFLCRDSSGTPTGYMAIEFGQYLAPDIEAIVRDRGRTIIVPEIFWLDPDTRQALFNVLRNHRDQRRYAVIVRPVAENFVDLLDEPRIVQRSVRPNSMVRLIDVRAVLESLRVGCPEGEFTIRLDDPLCPWNETPLRLTIRDGRILVGEAADSLGDLTADIGSFSQLVAGFRTVDQLVNTARLNVDAGKVELVRSLFPPCTNFLRDFF